MEIYCTAFSYTVEVLRINNALSVQFYIYRERERERDRQRERQRERERQTDKDINRQRGSWFVCLMACQPLTVI